MNPLFSVRMDGSKDCCWKEGATLEVRERIDRIAIERDFAGNRFACVCWESERFEFDEIKRDRCCLLSTKRKRGRLRLDVAAGRGPWRGERDRWVLSVDRFKCSAVRLREIKRSEKEKRKETKEREREWEGEKRAWRRGEERGANFKLMSHSIATSLLPRLTCLFGTIPQTPKLRSEFFSSQHLSNVLSKLLDLFFTLAPSPCLLPA